MIHKLTKCLTAGALVVTLAIAPPALAFHGGGGGFGGRMHGGVATAAFWLSRTTLKPPASSWNSSRAADTR